MNTWIVVGLLLLGGFFMFTAALGIVVMPDLFTRMHAASKSATIGAACLLLAVAFFFQNVGIAIRALLIVAFLLLTVPIAAHVIARAAYTSRVPLWEGTVIDELRENYDLATHSSRAPAQLITTYEPPPADTNWGRDGPEPPP